MTDISQLTDSFHLNLSAFGLLSFAVGLFIVHSTIGLAFEQRRAMMRSMRSMGVSLRTLIISVTTEMMILAMFGAVFGIVLGYLIAGFCYQMLRQPYAAYTVQIFLEHYN